MPPCKYEVYNNEKFLLYFKKQETSNGGFYYDLKIVKPYTKFIANEVCLAGDDMEDIFPLSSKCKLTISMLEKENGIYLVDVDVLCAVGIDGVDIEIDNINNIKPVLIFDEVNPNDAGKRSKDGK
jgi:hypothetical protein